MLALAKFRFTVALVCVCVYIISVVMYAHSVNRGVAEPDASIAVSLVQSLIGNPPTYVLGDILGVGYVSTVYSGENIFSGQQVVIKLTEINETEINNNEPGSNLNRPPASVAKLRRLDMEYDLYKRLNNSRLLKAYWYGPYDKYQALVIERVGPSLEHHQQRNRQWSLEDIYRIGQGVLLDLQSLHDQSFTHNDIHMGNIAYSSNGSRHRVNLMDFNNCHLYRSPVEPYQHEPQHRNPLRVPVHRYSPPCTHRRMHCSRRDDVIALGYVLVMLASQYANCFDIHYLRCHALSAADTQQPFYSPPLPWLHVPNKYLSAFMKRIDYNILNAAGPNSTGSLPEPFQRYFSHTTSLKFTSRPNYQHLIDILARLPSSTPQ